MIQLPSSVRVYLCLTACDMRKSFDGLHALVREHLELDAFTGHLFVFTSRQRDRLKILYWDRDGFAVWSKLGGRHVRGAVRRERRGASAGDHGTEVRGAAERDRPEPSPAAQAVSAIRISIAFAFFFCLADSK